MKTRESSGLVGFPIRNVPADLKQAIVAEVEASGRNMNDVVVSILAKHFEVPFEPTGRRPARLSASSTLVPVMPQPLRVKINVAGTVGSTSGQEVALEVLARHFGIRFARRARTRRVRPSRAAA